MTCIIATNQENHDELRPFQEKRQPRWGHHDRRNGRTSDNSPVRAGMGWLAEELHFAQGAQRLLSSRPLLSPTMVATAVVAGVAAVVLRSVVPALMVRTRLRGLLWRPRGDWGSGPWPR